MTLDLKKVCTNKIFWMSISASFAFTVIMFNIAMDANSANAEAIQIVSEEFTNDIQSVIDSNVIERQIDREDIKQILKDTSYIRGIIESDRGK